MTVITTLQLGALWFSNIPAFKRDDLWYQFCVDGEILYKSAAIGSLWMMAILVCSIYFTLVTQLCGVHAVSQEGFLGVIDLVFEITVRKFFLS